MRRNRLLALFGLAAILGSAHGQDPKPAMIAPFIDDETTAVVRLDLTKLDVMKSAHRLLGPFADKGPTTKPLRDLALWTDSLRKVGAKEVYFLLRVVEDSGGPAVIVPLVAGADSEEIRQTLAGKSNRTDSDTWVNRVAFGNVVFTGSPDDLKRAEAAGIKSRMPAWISEGEKAVTGNDVRILLNVNPGLRQTIDQQSPNLPPAFGGGPSNVLTRGLKWAAIGVQVDPKATVRLSAKATDAEAAQALERLAKVTLKTLGPVSTHVLKVFGPDAPEIPELPKLVERIAIKIDANSLSTSLDVEAIAERIRPLLAQIRPMGNPVQCVNNLKQIMLAMHNYHDANNSFPPAFRASEKGKPLLSWRVLILPYLDQNELYKQFHLDEPWDSPHNKSLIAKMPDVYRCPEIDPEKAPVGKTTYVTPRGEQTMFPGATGVSIAQVTDGTSNTIAVVDAGADNMVVWTVPDDWEIDGIELKPETILKQHGGGALARGATSDWPTAR